ncbi:FliH/SctL family protein [Fodinibius sp. Rm-B-1B1-1]|uniref:FliH/SctL family protein n=1 Tax=Fodinibius alkaliphilus TaxID=3140241 RepID=UPI003159A555
MEDDQNVLHTEELNWYEEDENRLDYDLAFNGNGYKKSDAEKKSEAEPEPKVDVKKLIKKRDGKWEQRLEKARKKAFEEGRKCGYEEGFNEAEQQVDDKLDRLEQLVEKAHQDWNYRHQLLNPGLLDLVFDMVEKIVGLPVENPKIREQLENRLSALLHETDDEIKPQLWVSEQDFRFVEELVEKYAPELSLSIRVSEDCNPGEFEFETQNEMVVHRFREKLADLKDNMTLPSWK